METIWNNNNNFTLLTDFYEMTMAAGYLEQGKGQEIACFDLFFRSIPETGGFAIMAGVEQMIDYLNHLEFKPEDLEYLRSFNIFEQSFLDYLANFKFVCDVWAVPEGMPIFPHEPIVRVIGPVMQAQMIETMLLLTINHQSLIATKSSRIVRAAQGRPVMEFGARRAQGYDASVLGARAAYIGGVAGTSCTLAGKIFDIPVMGTMAHSWIQSFDDEYSAFKAYAEAYPENTQLLVDTYDTLNSGIPNAIRLQREFLSPRSRRLKAIRIDSGDLAYLTIKARRMLDAADMQDCQITVSNSIDEYLIRDLLHQGAQIDNFGVGERLITSKAEPVFSGVYKLCAIGPCYDKLEPRMKISENPGKITNPGVKEIWRIYDRESGNALADLLTLAHEEIDESKPLEIFDPEYTWKRSTITNYRCEKILRQIYRKGQCIYQSPSLLEIRQFCSEQLNTLWDSVKRQQNPHTYYVDLSQELWNLKDEYLRTYRKR